MDSRTFCAPTDVAHCPVTSRCGGNATPRPKIWPASMPCQLFPFSPGTGRQILKNGIQKNTRFRAMTMTNSRIIAQMVMMGMEKEQIHPTISRRRSLCCLGKILQAADARHLVPQLVGHEERNALVVFAE